MAPHPVFLIRGISVRFGDVHVFFLQTKVLCSWTHSLAYPVNPSSDNFHSNFRRNLWIPILHHVITDTILYTQKHFGECFFAPIILRCHILLVCKWSLESATVVVPWWSLDSDTVSLSNDHYINAVMITRWLYCLNAVVITRWQYCLSAAMITRWHHCISIEMVTALGSLDSECV